MAVVLSSEDNSYFSRSSLRRSHSQPKFVNPQPGFHASASTSHLYNQAPSSFGGDSVLSSALSSPRPVQVESSELSFTSTPAANSSIASDCLAEETKGQVALEEQIILPQYDKAGFYGHLGGLEPLPSPRTGDSDTVSTNDHDASASASRPDSPDVLERAEDDLSIKPQPSRHVDYLSHNWLEEDIWSSWKLIVSRRNEYSNSARLENASWRTWIKAKNKLSTVSPEKLNWLKDCDVTWLYGPLQTGTTKMSPTHTNANSGRISMSNSFVNKKPILKKRSMSEILLLRSLSSSSLIKQAAASVQAQQIEGGKRISKRPPMKRATTDYLTYPFASRRLSRENSSRLNSNVSSELVSPTSDRKHIHFNEQVAQCIALDIKGDDDDDDYDTERFMHESDSDDGAIMMKHTPRKRRPIPRKPKNHSLVSSENMTTIAMLPSTTLKYRDDLPDSTETAFRHSSISILSPVMSPSSSQETLRPSKKSGKFVLVDKDDGDDDENEDERSTLTRRIFTKSAESPHSGLRWSTSTSSFSAEPTGMRRTESGMLMPYEEGGPATASEGIFGRVIETVNTARDIAHVIWNVGWRK